MLSRRWGGCIGPVGSTWLGPLKINPLQPTVPQLSTASRGACTVTITMYRRQACGFTHKSSDLPLLAVLPSFQPMHVCDVESVLFSCVDVHFGSGLKGPMTFSAGR